MNQHNAHCTSVHHEVGEFLQCSRGTAGGTETQGGSKQVTPRKKQPRLGLTGKTVAFRKRLCRGTGGGGKRPPRDGDGNKKTPDDAPDLYLCKSKHIQITSIQQPLHANLIDRTTIQNCAAAMSHIIHAPVIPILPSVVTAKKKKTKKGKKSVKAKGKSLYRKGNTRKVLFLNLVQLLLLLRRGQLGYIPHREIRRWRAAAIQGLLGVCLNPHKKDAKRMKQAVALLDTLPEEDEDMDSSEDDDDLLTISDEEILPDSGNSDSSEELQHSSDGAPAVKKSKTVRIPDDDDAAAPPPLVALARGGALVDQLADALERNTGPEEANAAAAGGVDDEGEDSDGAANEEEMD